MSKLALILFGFVASMIVFVECCTTKDDCLENGCCFNNVCNYNSRVCGLFESLCKQYSRRDCPCSVDSDCTNGCCVSSRCKPLSYNFQCARETCYFNYECSSGCCKDFECERTSEACSDDDDPTSYVPTFQYPTTPYWPYYQRTTTWLTTQSSVDDGYDYDGDDSVDDYDGYNEDGSSGSSSSSGSSVGITFAVIILAIVKILFWAMWCSRRHRRRVVIVRRTACVAIVEHDHLQREHEQLAEGAQNIPEGPPPAYSPGPGPDDCEDATRDSRQTDQGEGLVTASGGVPQGAPTGPPPEYSPSIALDSGENSTQNAGENPPPTPMTLNAATEGTHGVPQGTSIGPTPNYSQ